MIARTNVGGPARQLVELARGLDPTRFEQRILVGHVADDEVDYLDLRAPDVDVIRIPGLGRAPRPADDARAMMAIRREIIRFRPDLVHTHTAKAGVLGRLAAMSAHVPILVHTFHGHLLHGYFSPQITRTVTFAERMLARRTAALVAVGERVRDDLLAAGVGDRDQWSVVPPGVGIGALLDTATARAALALPPDGVVIALIGRLVSVKRPDRFVEAAARVVVDRPDSTFLVVGDGPERVATEQAVKDAGLAGHFRFLGWRGDIETILAAIDVVVVTSDNEGMPVSLIEAGLAGRPSITTNVGSAAEVVVDRVTGFVVPPDAGAVADAIDRLASASTLRHRLGTEARNHTEAAFGAARLVNDTEALYRRLLGDAR